MEGLRIHAHAKLNLVLRVVGRREDGYHLLQSLICAIDLADEIVLIPQKRGIELSAPPGLGPVEQNLALRAAQALLPPREPGVRIVLHKRIPAGAGLGGGSSDAAAVLAGLNELFGLGKSVEELIGLGTKLGADVPFFLGKSPAWVEGIGERITPVELELPKAFLLVIPTFSCPTAQVYRAFDELSLPFSPPGPVPQVPPFSNDLWPVAAHVRPGLLDLRMILEGVPSLGVGMTGSGSALFLAFPSRTEAEAAQGRLAGQLGACLHVAVPLQRGYKITE